MGRARTLFGMVVLVTTMASAACVPVQTAEGPPPPPPPPPEFIPQGPAYGADQRYCDRDALSDVFRPTTGNVVGTAAGAAAGGLIGSQFGKSSGNTVATLTGIVAGALAGGAIARTMEPVDQACIHQALEHTPSNESIEWQNPRRHDSYWVTPTRTTEMPDGRPCRYYTTEALTHGRREAVTGYACRQPDGTWRNLR